VNENFRRARLQTFHLAEHNSSTESKMRERDTSGAVLLNNV